MTSSSGPRFTLAALTLGFANFAAVTTEFVVPGILAPMAKDIGVTVEKIGSLVTYFALGAGLAGPPIAAWAARLRPRTVLVAAMLLFMISNLAIAYVPSYTVMVAARIAQGSALPAIVSISSTTLAELAGPQGTGKAVSLLYLGVAAATVLGVPAGVFVAESAGWDATFTCMATLCLTAAILIGLTLHDVSARTELAGIAQFRLVGSRSFLLHLLLSTVLFSAMFCGYTYFPTYLEQGGGFTGTEIGLLLLAFGIAGFLGNLLAARAADHRAYEAAAVAASLLCITMLGIPVFERYLPLFIGLVLLWGSVHSSLFVLNQVRVMNAGRAAPNLASSLNISACNLGISIGAAVGGWALAEYGTNAPALVAAGISLIAAALGISMKAYHGC